MKIKVKMNGNKVVYCFFFSSRRRHTRCYRDWSSDVCSSDLWCGLNFWRCRHAHCVITGAGWLALAVFTFVEAGLGRSLIGGNEPPVFLVVLGTGLVFEAAWYLARGSNAVTPISCGRR